MSPPPRSRSPSPPADEPPTRSRSPSPTAPRAATAEPRPPQPTSPPAAAAATSPSGDGHEGARVIALNMALNGSPRDETARYLDENFELEDPEALLDEVYARVGS